MPSSHACFDIQVVDPQLRIALIAPSDTKACALKIALSSLCEEKWGVAVANDLQEWDAGNIFERRKEHTFKVALREPVPSQLAQAFLHDAVSRKRVACSAIMSSFGMDGKSVDELCSELTRLHIARRELPLPADLAELCTDPGLTATQKQVQRPSVRGLEYLRLGDAGLDRRAPSCRFIPLAFCCDHRGLRIGRSWHSATPST